MDRLRDVGQDDGVASGAKYVQERLSRAPAFPADWKYSTAALRLGIKFSLFGTASLTPYLLDLTRLHDSPRRAETIC